MTLKIASIKLQTIVKLQFKCTAINLHVQYRVYEYLVFNLLRYDILKT